MFEAIVEAFWGPDNEKGWSSGSEVGGLDIDFGQHLMLHRWTLEAEVKPDCRAISYKLTDDTQQAQGVNEVATMGIGCGDRAWVVFQFDTAEAAAQAAETWPLALPVGEFNDRVLAAASASWRFRRTKIPKGAVAFYIYAVKETHAVFGSNRRLEALIERTQELEEVEAWSTTAVDNIKQFLWTMVTEVVDLLP